MPAITLVKRKIPQEFQSTLIQEGGTVSNQWKIWANIFAWQENCEFYINSETFGLITSLPLPIGGGYAHNSDFINAVSQGDYPIIEDVSQPFVCIGFRIYVSVDWAIETHRELYHKNRLSEDKKRSKSAIWHNFFADELVRIQKQFPEGIPSYVLPSAVFSDDLYKSIYWHAGVYGDEYCQQEIKALNSDLFVVKKSPDGSVEKTDQKKDVYFIQVVRQGASKSASRITWKVALSRFKRPNPLSCLL